MHVLGKDVLCREEVGEGTAGGDHGPDDGMGRSQVVHEPRRLVGVRCGHGNVEHLARPIVGLLEGKVTK